MPPKLNLFTTRSVAFRTRSLVPQKRSAVPLLQQRFAGDDASQQPKGPNQEQAPHVTEEQAAVDKIMGETPPDVDQGTPVQEILQRDPEAEDKAPEVLKKKPNGPSSSSQSRSYSTSARKSAMDMQQASQPDAALPISMEYPDGGFGHKFPLPEVGSIPRTDHLKRRYDPIVNQVTKALMWDGKLSRAQSNMTRILEILRTAPPPQPNPQFPLRTLLTTAPRNTLPLTPIEYLKSAIDSVAPLLKIRQQRGVAGGGASLPLPVPLGLRQRRRAAINWILASAASRREINFADRVAREIIRVAEGTSSAWEKRQMVHRLGISARSNIRTMLLIGRSKRR